MILGLFGAPKADMVGTEQMSADPWALLPAASTNAQAIDTLYVFITALCGISMLGVVGAQVYFMWKYKKPANGHRKTSPITHNGRLEFIWSAIPALFMIVLFAWGEIGFVEQFSPPPDAINVRVTGQKWDWTVEYPDYPGAVLSSSSAVPTEEQQKQLQAAGEWGEDIIDRKPTLIVPTGVPVRLTLTSKDVIHSFYIPVFRLKRDAVPGRYTTYWFEATQEGEFPLFCAEYCGDEHSSMIGYVKVVSAEQFEVELKEATKLEQKDAESLADFGKRVFDRGGCKTCHNIDNDEAKTGPSLKGIWGRSEQLTDGSTITADDNYIRESVLDPNAKIVSGFSPQMPSFAGRFNDEHITALIEYLKTLK